MTSRSDYLGITPESAENAGSTVEREALRGFTKEQLLFSNLKHIAQEYLELEKLKQQFTELILKKQEQLDFSEFIKYPKYHIKESTLIHPAESANIRGLNIVSVDGSSVVKNFVDVDFSFLKAIAVKYYFNENHRAQIEYYPDLSGFNNYSIQGNYVNKEERFVEAKVSMDMTFMEINLLNKMIQLHSSEIDFIIIDGSIVPMPINLIFSKDPLISKKYDKLLKEYKNLYANCMNNNIFLIGSIKDTRTSALCHLIRDSIQLLKPNYSHLKEFTEINYREVMKYFCDLDLFNRLLDKCERSCIFRCKQEIDKIRDTGLKGEIPHYFPVDFYAFYLKTAKYDSPCRIEFFMDECHKLEEASDKAKKIASILLPMASLNEHYGLPIPQIEAHKRAVFNPQEINLLFNNLARTLNIHGLRLLEKRRNRRPF